MIEVNKNMKMEEELISFETAKLAKEKGFNIETLHFYCKNRTCDYIETPYKYSFEVDANQENSRNGEIDNFGYGITWSAPTQSLLQKWLREVHNIDITTSLVANDYGFYIHKDRNYTNKGENYGISGITYEEALEKGLQEALKLI